MPQAMIIQKAKGVVFGGENKLKRGIKASGIDVVTNS